MEGAYGPQEPPYDRRETGSQGDVGGTERIPYNLDLWSRLQYEYLGTPSAGSTQFGTWARERKHGAKARPDPLESKQNKGHTVTGRGRPEHRASDEGRK